MTKPISLYHNELLGAVSIASVLKHNDLSNAQVLFILPLLFHNETLNYFLNHNPRNIKSFASNNSKIIANFDNRLYSLLPVTINSILIAKKIGLINIEKDRLSFKDFDFEADLGNRAKKIILASKKIASLLKKTETSDLFFHLKVKL